jgi:hypothetical protein
VSAVGGFIVTRWRWIVGEHTKEPWEAYHDTYHDLWEVVGDGDVVCQLWRLREETHDRFAFYEGQDDANAMRIAASVNACAGIPTADLASGVVPVGVVKRLVRTLEVQQSTREAEAMKAFYKGLHDREAVLRTYANDIAAALAEAEAAMRGDQ